MNVLFAAVPVGELAAAIEWYIGLFGRAPDIVPNDDEVMWRVADGGWLYVVRDPERAGNGLVTIAVEDLDRVVAELARRGLVTDRVEAVGDAGRKAWLADPEGNTIALVEVAQAGG